MAARLPLTIWLFGLPGSGKTTLATHLKRRFDAEALPSCLLDGDVLRSGLSRDLGFDSASRAENIRRAAEVAVILRNTGITPICAFITPEARYRDAVRQVVGESHLLSVYLPTTVETCSRRDPKGLYHRAQEGKIQDMTGVQAGFQPPGPAETHCVIDAEFCPPEQSARALADLVFARLRA